MPRGYPAEFRCKVLDLVKTGRPVREVARDLEISEQTIYVWRRQDLIDSGQVPGVKLTLLRDALRKLAAELAADDAFRDPDWVGKLLTSHHLTGRRLLEHLHSAGDPSPIAEAAQGHGTGSSFRRASHPEASTHPPPSGTAQDHPTRSRQDHDR
jgi:transposase